MELRLLHLFFFFFLVPLYLKKTAFSLFFLVEQPLSESHIAVIRRYVWIICVMFVCACALPLFPHMPLRCYSHSFFVSSRSRFFLSFPLLLSLLLLLKLLLTFSVLRVSISSFLFFFFFSCYASTRLSGRITQPTILQYFGGCVQ